MIDTAGLRETADEVERVGIDRTWRAIEEQAGAALFIEDASGPSAEDSLLRDRMPPELPIARVINKIDLSGEEPGRRGSGDRVEVRVSAKAGSGMDGLRAWLLEIAGWKPHGEGLFIARERHLVAIEAAREAISRAGSTQAIEIKAEELRGAQAALGSITGEVSADQLLGEIFGRFCIGK